MLLAKITRCIDTLICPLICKAKGGNFNKEKKQQKKYGKLCSILVFLIHKPGIASEFVIILQMFKLII